MNGIIVIDKEAGMTSADVVYHLRKILHFRKIGHAGTLDPEVTGVLPVAIGQATKLIERMHEKPKAYQGTGLFGLKTNSYDLDGEILAEKKLDSNLTKEEISEAMNSFLGQITQVPPIYSAVKVNGKKLYEYARNGEEVELPKRQVEVFEYNLIGEPRFDSEKGQVSFDFEIKCSKGTYVRSLVNDLGDKLGIPAVMTKLRRTASSGFTEKDAVSLQSLQENPEKATEAILPIASYFKDVAKYDLNDAEWKKVSNGASVQIARNDNQIGLYYKGVLKAIYKKQGNIYKADLMLLQNS
ncbi:MAG: tRNA pseudouridine(55) synthase TruB [Lactobacillus sp.]|nr:tRNA pseudouridine(55) synthase TruB [Lactobacillus sp.]